jgi:hypothetical protein
MFLTESPVISASVLLRFSNIARSRGFPQVPLTELAFAACGNFGCMGFVKVGAWFGSIAGGGARNGYGPLGNEDLPKSPTAPVALPQAALQ